MPSSPSRASARRRGKKRQSLDQLRRLQRLTGTAVIRSLAKGDRMQSTWIDGRDMHAVADGIIKPNDRLTSFERLEIYNRQYWFRLLDCLNEDYPGLVAILGEKKFDALSRAYLAKYPSRSHSLRNLGSDLVRFLTEQPHWAHPYEQMALDMARFEWAQVTAFDGLAKPAITAADLRGRDPSRLRLELQPYLALLEMAYPLDDFTLAMKKRIFRSEASNAVEDEPEQAAPAKRPPRPRRRQTCVAVHRLRNDLYFKRMAPREFAILTALGAGRTLTQACQAAGDTPPNTIQHWFETWTALGWFCKPSGA
jgi:Putative DNA-binding domain